MLTSDSPTGIEETKCKRLDIVHLDDGPCVKVYAPCTFDDWGGNTRELHYEDFGRTVFLTREDAEKAMEKERNGK